MHIYSFCKIKWLKLLSHCPGSSCLLLLGGATSLPVNTVGNIENQGRSQHLPVNMYMSEKLRKGNWIKGTICTKHTGHSLYIAYTMHIPSKLKRKSSLYSCEQASTFIKFNHEVGHSRVGQLNTHTKRDKDTVH